MEKISLTIRSLRPFALSAALFFSVSTGASALKKVKPPKKPMHEEQPWVFNGKLAFEDIRKQLSFGPRYVSSPGHLKLEKYLETKLKLLASANLILQKWDHKGMGGNISQLKNIVARFAPERSKRILLATHYDSKQFANMDNNPKLKLKGVPGANDSGSGTAVLLELARNLALLERRRELNIGVDLIFIDGEEGESIPLKADQKAWVWSPLGSTHLAANITEIYRDGLPVLGIVIDMIGDKNLNIHYETNSFAFAPAQVKALWDVGRVLAPDVFIPAVKYNIIDDHIPLNKIGIPTMLLIDFDYPPWHTMGDTLDKCDRRSLMVVGQTLLNYLKQLN